MILKGGVGEHPEGADFHHVSHVNPSDKSMASGAGEEMAGEKGVDETIPREGSWGRISKNISPDAVSGSVNAEEKRHSGEIHPAPGWSDIPRRDVEGVSEGSGAGDRPSEVHGPSPKTLSDNFNKQVMEAILGKSHHRLSENAVSMPPINPDTPPAKRVQADTAPMPEETGPGTDDWLEKANAALLRLRKKREEEAMPPQQTPQSPAQEQAPPVNSFKEPDSVVEDNASVVESEDRPMVEDSLVAGFEEGSGEGMSSEAYMSKMRRMYTGAGIRKRSVLLVLMT